MARRRKGSLFLRNECVRPELADCVEEVWQTKEVDRTAVLTARSMVRGGLLSGRLEVRCRDQLRQLSEVLGGCREEELVAGAVGSSQSKSIQLQDAFEVCKQHFDLLAQPPRGPTVPRPCNLARHVASALMD